MYFGDQQMYFVGLISSCLIITYHCEILFMKLIVLVIHSLIAQILVLFDKNSLRFIYVNFRLTISFVLSSI